MSYKPYQCFHISKNGEISCSFFPYKMQISKIHIQWKENIEVLSRLCHLPGSICIFNNDCSETLKCCSWLETLFLFFNVFLFNFLYLLQTFIKTQTRTKVSSKLNNSLKKWTERVGFVYIMLFVDYVLFVIFNVYSYLFYYL